jgi:hypothetical protein
MPSVIRRTDTIKETIRSFTPMVRILKYYLWYFEFSKIINAIKKDRKKYENQNFNVL